MDNGNMGNTNYYYAPPAQPKKSGLCIAALVFGILAAVFGLVGLGGLFAILGLIFSIVSLAKKLNPKGLAVAGLILSIISLVWGCVSAVVVVFILVAFGTAVVTALTSLFNSIGLNPEYLEYLELLNDLNSGYEYDVDPSTFLNDFDDLNFDYDDWDESFLLDGYDDYDSNYDDYLNVNDNDYNQSGGFYVGNIYFEDLEQYGYSLDYEDLNSDEPFRQYIYNDAYFTFPEYAYADYTEYGSTKMDSFMDWIDYWNNELEDIEVKYYSDKLTSFNDEWEYAYCEYYIYDEDYYYLDYSVFAYSKTTNDYAVLTVDTSGDDDSGDLNNLISLMNHIHIY